MRSSRGGNWGIMAQLSAFGLLGAPIVIIRSYGQLVDLHTLCKSYSADQAPSTVRSPGLENGNKGNAVLSLRSNNGAFDPPN